MLRPPVNGRGRCRAAESSRWAAAASDSLGACSKMTMMESNLPEAARLIHEAVSGPPGRAELVTEGGRPVRIERDPEPGIKLRLTLAEAGEDTVNWRAILIEPLDRKPYSYPGQVPFVSGVETIVAVFGETVSAIWRPSQGPVCPVPEQEPDEELVELSQRLSALREELKARGPDSRAEAGQRVKAIIDSLDLGARAKLTELWQKMRPAAEVIGRLEQVFEDVLGASVEDGWDLFERKELKTPIRSMSAKLERESESRSILMMGLNQSVVMIQGPRSPDAGT